MLMKHWIIIILFFANFTGQSQALSPRIANYEIDLRLDEVNKRVKADQVLVWKNLSNDVIESMPFHLYYNAFKNSNSTFMKEREFENFLGNDMVEKCHWGWLEIESILDENGMDLRPSAKYIQPDDNNVFDQTVLEVYLNEGIQPGDSIVLKIKWESQIPKIMPRTGYNMDYYFMAQWFPKVGVYEYEGVHCSQKGKWNCHQYHSSGEYYSDFGNYLVNINVPSDYIVAASGVLQKQDKKEDRTTWTFFAHDVIDFTWTTSPHYVLEEDQYKDTKIKLYSYEYKCHLKDRYVNTLKFAMAYLEEHLGPYPYPTISVIDPPIHGIFTGGMEYPNLITSLSFCFFPKGIKTPETLIVHEYIHQYFMQMVASHEVEDTWMDEGFTTYFEGRILDAMDGPQTSTIDFWGVKAGNAEFNRAEFFAMENPKIAANTLKSWQFKHGGYGEISYNKTAIWLKTLEGMIGIETMDEIMKTYFQRVKFTHPCKDDFIQVVNDVVRKNHGERFGPDMNWYFKQVLEGTDVCDYAISSIQNQEIKGAAGYLNGIDDCVVPGANAEAKKFHSEVIIHRLGEIQVPTEIKVNFEDGSSKLIPWDGKDRSFSFELESAHKIVSADIDPERKIYLDKNFINNSKAIEKQSKGIRKYFAQFMVTLQNIMEGASWFS